MRALWIAPDGTRHEIEYETKEQVMDEISRLRFELGFKEPDAVLVQSDDEDIRESFGALI